MKTKVLLGGIIILGLALLIGGCAKSPEQLATPGAGAKTMLTGAGATFPYPLYSKWIAEYATLDPQININYQSIGSGGGIQQLKAGTVDFGASDAPLSDEEMKAMPAPVVHIPTVAGAVAVIYNLPGLTKPLRLNADALAGIYSGEIKQWDDSRIAALNPGVKLPKLAVAIAHRSDGSGTSYIFTHYLAAVSKPWAQKVGSGKSVDWPVGIGGKGNEGVTGIVKQTPGAVGYVELAYAEQNKLAYAQLQNLAGNFVSPSLDTTKAAAAGALTEMQKDVRVSIVNAPGAQAYPISGFTYILLYQQIKDAKKKTALLDFLNWAIGDGQQYAGPLGYAPLPAEIVTLNKKALAGIK
jgi:phosphate transport system substrate-binding protein